MATKTTIKVSDKLLEYLKNEKRFYKKPYWHILEQKLGLLEKTERSAKNGL